MVASKVNGKGWILAPNNHSMASLSMIVALLLFNAIIPSSALEFKYFAIGSNMYTGTMTALREIKYLDATAGILPGYKLRFNLPGTPLIEPSWASVQPSSDPRDYVHGVLYSLTPSDFARLSISEGVPFGYRWQECRVTPYLGDGNCAGRNAVRDKESACVKANVLVTTNPFLWRDIPPSKAYRDLLIRGALEFQMDQDYIAFLESVPIGRTIGDGLIAKDLLEAAERREANNNSRKER